MKFQFGQMSETFQAAETSVCPRKNRWCADNSSCSIWLFRCVLWWFCCLMWVDRVNRKHSHAVQINKWGVSKACLVQLETEFKLHLHSFITHLQLLLCCFSLFNVIMLMLGCWVVGGRNKISEDLTLRHFLTFFWHCKQLIEKIICRLIDNENIISSPYSIYSSIKSWKLQSSILKDQLWLQKT